MAYVVYNSIITQLSGKFGDIVFSQRKGKPYIKRYAKPRDPRTPGQLGARERFRRCAAQWKALSSEERFEWSRKARKTKVSGYNLFMRERMRKHDLHQN